MYYQPDQHRFFLELDPNPSIKSKLPKDHSAVACSCDDGWCSPGFWPRYPLKWHLLFFESKPEVGFLKVSQMFTALDLQWWCWCCARAKAKQGKWYLLRRPLEVPRQGWFITAPAGKIGSARSSSMLSSNPGSKSGKISEQVGSPS